MNTLAFIGGGNMASAIIGGLLKSGRAPADILVLEPNADQRSRLQRELGVITLEAPGSVLQRAAVVTWAIKPQNFKEAAAACAPHVAQALQFSVMAGIRSGDMVRALGTERVVRSMPNTPALIGQGIAGLYARPAIGDDERREVERLLAPTGRTLWVAREEDLDAVTALSGSGPAYVFYFVEAMMKAAQDLGLSAEQGRARAGDLLRRGRAGTAIGRGAVGVARARHVQGRHDACRPHLAGTQRRARCDRVGRQGGRAAGA